MAHLSVSTILYLCLVAANLNKCDFLHVHCCRVIFSPCLFAEPSLGLNKQVTCLLWQWANQCLKSGKRDLEKGAKKIGFMIVNGEQICCMKPLHERTATTSEFNLLKLPTCFLTFRNWKMSQHFYSHFLTFWNFPFVFFLGDFQAGNDENRATFCNLRFPGELRQHLQESPREARQPDASKRKNSWSWECQCWVSSHWC